MNKIRNENEEITTDNTEIQRIRRDYYQQLHANKMDNVEEMDKFLEKINSLALSLLYGPTFTSIHDYWKNYGFDYTDFCQQSNISAF